MTCYYLEVLVSDVSIELDSDVHYYHHYHVGDIIKIYMYSDKGPKVSFGDKPGQAEYDAQFTYQWDSIQSKRLTISSLIQMGYVCDITKMLDRNEKLSKLGI